MKDETASNSKKNSEKVNNYNRINSSTGIRDTNLFSKDFLFFKNDILKDIKDLEIKLENQKKVNAELIKLKQIFIKKNWMYYWSLKQKQRMN